MPTEVSNQLDRIEGAVGDIKTAIANKGVTVPSGTKIDGLAPLVSSISVQAKLQDKRVAPSHIDVSVTADSGYDGLGTVTVTKIPLNYADTSSGDAVAGEILKDKKAWVDGSEVTGTMENRGAVTETLGMNTAGFFKEWAEISAGYHNGNGRIKIVGETKTVTPDDTTQQIFPTGGTKGSVLSKVTVNPIPSKYKDTTGANATPAQVIEGSKFLGANGVVETGTMPIYEDGSAYLYENSMDDEGNFYWGCYFESNVIIPEGESSFKIPSSEFGNAKASDVRAGVNFTSTEGVWKTGTMPDGDYDIRMSMFGEEGYVDVVGTNVTLNEVSSKPSSGYYIKANGRGKVAGCGEAVIKTAGYIDEGSKMGGGTDIEHPDGSFVMWSNNETKYYTIATEEKTVTPSTSAQTVTPTSGKLLSKVTVNAISTATQATPSITVSSAGLITASATQTAGYVSAGTQSATKQLTTQGAKTVTPTTSNQTAVASGRYTTGAVTVKGDSNLVAGNIKKGVSIFGVAGTYEGGASVATCTINVTFTTNAGNTLTSATTFANGTFSAFNSTSSSGTFTIQNVVCGSALSIGTTYMCSLYWSGSQQGHYSAYGGMITVPSASGTYTVEVGALDD